MLLKVKHTVKAGALQTHECCCREPQNEGGFRWKPPTSDPGHKQWCFPTFLHHIGPWLLFVKSGRLWQLLSCHGGQRISDCSFNAYRNHRDWNYSSLSQNLVLMTCVSFVVFKTAASLSCATYFFTQVETCQGFFLYLKRRQNKTWNTHG